MKIKNYFKNKIIIGLSLAFFGTVAFSDAAVWAAESKAGEDVQVFEAADAQEVLELANEAENMEELPSSDAELKTAGEFYAKRLILMDTTLTEYPGADSIILYPEYNETVLDFATEEATEAAYNELSEKYGEDNCFPDLVIRAEDICMEGDTGTDSDKETNGEIEPDGDTEPGSDTDTETETDLVQETTVSSVSWGTKAMGMDLMKAAAADSDLTSELTVAVLDTGINADHEMFAGRTITGTNLFTGSNADNAGRESGHGTHVCGILADALPDNVSFLVMGMYDSRLTTTTLALISSFQYALEEGADIINLSWGYDIYPYAANTSPYHFLDMLMEEAYEQGVPVVTAAGNYHWDVKYMYPASIESSVSVSAMKQTDEGVAYDTQYSNYGSGIDYAAPGTDVRSAAVGSNTETALKSGTSMAAPHITAALTWMMLLHPGYNVDQLQEALNAYCIDLGDAGKDNYYGNGCPDFSGLSAELETALLENTEHRHSYKKTVIASTCTENGSVTYTCACGDSYTRSILSGGHQYKLKAFDTSAGLAQFVCLLCADTKTVPMSGACTDQISWSYDKTDKCLYFTGEGDIPAEEEYPWGIYKDTVKKVIISQGITSLPDRFLADFKILEEVYCQGDAPAFGENCFLNDGGNGYYNQAASGWDEIPSGGGYLYWDSYTANAADWKIVFREDTFTAAGEQICPKIIVKAGYSTLIENTEYRVSYGENCAAGEGTVTVSGMAEYFGSLTVTFKIDPAPAAVSEAAETESNAASASVQKTAVTKQTVTKAAVKKQTVKPLAKGKVFKLKSVNGVFKVTNSSAAHSYVTFQGLYKKNVKKVTIPATVTYKGISYKVRAISAKAFYKNKKIKTLVIKASLTSIGKKAFSGCKSLKKVYVKEKKKLSAYKKMLKKAGLSKKTVVKKV